MWPVDRPPLEGVASTPGIQHVLMTADAVGGVWRYAVDLGGALASRGIRVTLAVMGPSPDDTQRRDADRRGLAVVHRAYRLEWMDEPWEDVRRAGEWLLALERTLSPDVVHLNGYSHAVLPWAAPVVVVAHSCVRTWWRAVKGEAAPARLEPYRAAVAAGLERAALVIAPTSAMRDALEAEYGVHPGTRVVPNGCMELGAGSVSGHTKADVVFAAGRIWDEAKNITALCRAAHHVRWPVCVAGDDREPGGRACAMPAVRRLGRLAPPEMREWYRRASIYALPAKYEPFGLSVLEAASARCALVLGDIESLRENWTGAAEFVPPSDSDAIAAAIERLIERPARRRELADRAAARAARFTVASTAAAYLRLYEEVAG